MCYIQVDACTLSSLGAIMAGWDRKRLGSPVYVVCTGLTIYVYGSNKRQQARPPDTPDTKQVSLYHGILVYDVSYDKPMVDLQCMSIQVRHFEV